MSFLGKEYVFVKDENFDGFLKFVGLPDDKIQQMASFHPSQKLTQTGDSYTYHSATPTGPKDQIFKSGEEFDDVIGPDRHPIKSTFVLEGNVLTQVIKSQDGREVVFVREFSDNELVVTIKSKDWDGTAKRYYKA